MCISKLHRSYYLHLTCGDMVYSALSRLPLISWELQLFSFIPVHQKEPLFLLAETCLCGTPFRCNHPNRWHWMWDRRATWGLACAEEVTCKKLSDLPFLCKAWLCSFQLNRAQATLLTCALQATGYPEGRSNMTSSAKKGDERCKELYVYPLGKALTAKTSSLMDLLGALPSWDLGKATTQHFRLPPMGLQWVNWPWRAGPYLTE